MALLLGCPGRVATTAAGRTDAGVHATGQVVHADLPRIADPSRLARRLNGVLPPDLRLLRLRAAPAGFDARFSALSRRYRYRIADRVADPLRRHDTAAHPRPLQLASMREAVGPLLGEHDFRAFCRPRPGATTVRCLLRVSVFRREGAVIFMLEADAFCHRMVRALVGVLLAVGDGRRPVDWPAQVLASRSRDGSPPMAPALGLTLVAVRYPPVAGLAARALTTRQLRAPAPREAPHV